MMYVSIANTSQALEYIAPFAPQKMAGSGRVPGAIKIALNGLIHKSLINN
jgi:hypothetical protein